MEMSWPKEQPYNPHLLHQGCNHKNLSQKHKMWLFSQKSENLPLCPNLCHLMGSLTHLLVKIIPLDQFDANIDGINVLIFSFIWFALNWLYDMKITSKLSFAKKCRFLSNAFILAQIPIVKEVISRFWAFRSNFL